MNNKLEQYLYNKYPDLFQDHTKPPSESCMHWGCTCGDGWIYLIDSLCLAITEHIKDQHYIVDWYSKEDEKFTLKGKVPPPRPDWFKDKIPVVKFLQVKEKFGHLRIYFEGGDDFVKNIVEFVCMMSGFICEECGRFDYSVGNTTQNQIKILCNKCCNSKNPIYKIENKWELHKNNKDISDIIETFRFDPKTNQFI